MIDQRQINELTARLAKLETMLQNNDAYAPPGAVKLDDMDLGPGIDFSVPDYTGFMNQVKPDVVWDPQFSSEQQTALQEENFGFGPTDSTITDLQQRLNAMETFISGGSNDTNQSGALGADQSTSQNGLGGQESPAFIPAPIEFFHTFGLSNGVYATGTNLSFNSGVGAGILNPYSIFSEPSGLFTAPRSGYVVYAFVISGRVATVPAGTTYYAESSLLVNGTIVTQAGISTTGSGAGAGSFGNCIIQGCRYFSAGDIVAAQFDSLGATWTFYPATGFMAHYLDIPA